MIIREKTVRERRRFLVDGKDASFGLRHMTGKGKIWDQPLVLPQTSKMSLGRFAISLIFFCLEIRGKTQADFNDAPLVLMNPLEKKEQ